MRHESPIATLSLASPIHKDRTVAENFVRRVFAQAYDAKVNSFLQHLLILRQNNVIEGVIGFSDGQKRLWLEDYLEEHPCKILAEKYSLRVERSKIAEVGNLASNNCLGNGRVLVMAMTELLCTAGFEWVVFTSTAHLRLFFRRLRVTLLKLGNADFSRLTDIKSYWGNYYEHQPEVVALNLNEMRQRFELTATVKASRYLKPLCQIIGNSYREVQV